MDLKIKTFPFEFLKFSKYEGNEWITAGVLRSIKYRDPDGVNFVGISLPGQNGLLDRDRYSTVYIETQDQDLLTDR